MDSRQRYKREEDMMWSCLMYQVGTGKKFMVLFMCYGYVRRYASLHRFIWISAYAYEFDETTQRTFQAL